MRCESKRFQPIIEISKKNHSCDLFANSHIPRKKDFIFSNFYIPKMRKHGWQLPYHPLQVVAVSVFLALGFGFYVFFAPFVGKKMYQYIVMGIYTPLIVSTFGLYIWAAGADPADPGVFKSKKYSKTPNNKMSGRVKESKLGGESTSSIQDANAASVGGKSSIKNAKNQDLRMEDNVSGSVKQTYPVKSHSESRVWEGEMRTNLTPNP